MPKWLSLKIPLNFVISRGLEIPKSRDLPFGKIIWLALFNVDQTFFVSNVLQESIHKTNVLASFCSDHSSISFTLDMIKKGQRGKGLWKFNSSLLLNKKFVCHMKNHIANTTIFLNEENIFNDQTWWEYLKYEIRKFSVSEANKKKQGNENFRKENENFWREFD